MVQVFSSSSTSSSSSSFFFLILSFSTAVASGTVAGSWWFSGRCPCSYSASCSSGTRRWPETIQLCLSNCCCLSCSSRRWPNTRQSCASHCCCLCRRVHRLFFVLSSCCKSNSFPFISSFLSSYCMFSISSPIPETCCENKRSSFLFFPFFSFF